jgi:chromate reductase
MVGTARAQQHRRQTFVFTQSYPLAAPEVLVSMAHKKFDAQLRLIDEPTRAFVQQHLLLLRNWTWLLRGQPADHSPTR